MSLLDLKTDLKSLKYGKDQPGGGDSGQPYQKVDINTIDSKLNRFRMNAFDDGLIRGGVIGAANAAVVDTLRIGKFLTDFPKGPLFIVKQVGLQFSNPKLETKKLPSGPGILGFLGGLYNTIQDKLGLGPTRLYNLGINTLAQVPVGAFGVHFNRHGLLPIQDDNTKYLAVAQFNNKGNSSNNRLVGLTNKFNLGKNSTFKLTKKESGSFLFTLLTAGQEAANALFNSILLPAKTSTIDNYLGGPNSVYGVGRTLIKRYAPYTVDAIQATKDKSNPHQVKVDFKNISDLGIGGNAISSYGNIPTSENEIKAGINLNAANYANPSLKKYTDLKKQIDFQKTYTRPSFANNKGTYNNINQFGIYGDIVGDNQYNNSNTNITNPEWLPTSPDYPEYFNGTNIVKIKIPWNRATREVRVGSGKEDLINLTPLFNAPSKTIEDDLIINGKQYNINDLAKFRIQAINGDKPEEATYMVFRAYLTQFSDNTDAAWNPVKYAGRGEDFYIYGGFNRKIQIGFKVAALSAKEMEPMYQKLNFLMSNVMPDYNGLLMRGPMVKMTVGNWLDGQDGILNSVSYTIPNDSPWEIAINEPITGEKILILPHVVEVALTFTPIGSQTKGKNKISEKSYSTSHIAQNVNESRNQYIITGSIGTAGPLPKIGIESKASTANSDTDINNQFLAENPG